MFKRRRLTELVGAYESSTDAGMVGICGRIDGVATCTIVGGVGNSVGGLGSGSTIGGVAVIISGVGGITGGGIKGGISGGGISRGISRGGSCRHT